MEVFRIIFEDYVETGIVYHIVTISDLEKILREGLKYNGKYTYKTKYKEFHDYMDLGRPKIIPNWVIRSKAIFASLNFADKHTWHSHTAVLGLKINPERCWICNENIANFLYEPFMLRKISEFESANKFLERNGEQIIKDYWTSSLSFYENLLIRNDKKRGYDAEVLILHDIRPEDIKILYIASDHRYMSVEKWKKSFSQNNICYFRC